jgi:hypothetical protein
LPADRGTWTELLPGVKDRKPSDEVDEGAEGERLDTGRMGGYKREETFSLLVFCVQPGP